MRKPFRCPICGGDGIIRFEIKAEGEETRTNIEYCRTCDRTGVLWSPPRHDPSWFDFITNLGQLAFWATFLFWIIWVWS